MNHNNRPDLSTNQLATLAMVVLVVLGVTMAWPQMPAPGSGVGQSSAALGALLLLAPLCFTLMKRSGKASKIVTG